MKKYFVAIRRDSACMLGLPDVQAQEKMPSARDGSDLRIGIILLYVFCFVIVIKQLDGTYPRIFYFSRSDFF